MGRNKTPLCDVTQGERIHFTYFLDVAGSERYQCPIELLNNCTGFISVLSVMIVLNMILAKITWPLRTILPSTKIISLFGELKHLLNIL